MTKDIKVYCVFEGSDYEEAWTLLEIFTTRSKANAFIKRRMKAEPSIYTKYDIIMRRLL